jgi:hypothetical protein
MAKKKKAAAADAAAQQDAAGVQPSTSGRGRSYTVSMAVPGSMIDNTQNIEFATFVAGQVGRSNLHVLTAIDRVVLHRHDLNRGDLVHLCGSHCTEQLQCHHSCLKQQYHQQKNSSSYLHTAVISGSGWQPGPQLPCTLCLHPNPDPNTRAPLLWMRSELQCTAGLLM